MRTPKLSKHKASGQFFIHYAGRDHYLGKDKDEAEVKYLDHLGRWREWQQQKARRKLMPQGRCAKVVELVEKFTMSKRRERGWTAYETNRKRLVRFASLYSGLEADAVRPRHLQALKMNMIDQGYAPRTINHDLVAIRSMFRWASGMELAPPVDLSGVRNLPVGPAVVTTYPPDQVACMVHELADDVLAPWLALNYLALCRPSEVVKLIHGEGEFVDEGVFRLDRGKMDERSAMHRHVILSPQALGWMARAEPRWKEHNGYCQYLRKKIGAATPIRPKALQKSAAQHLVTTHDIPAADVELLLGHVPSRLQATYYRPAFPRLLRAAGLLSLGG